MGNTEKYLDKLHREIIVIMDEIVRICDKYSLSYYLVGGTLLGAVRHKGFIPWDDDLDIAMPRSDFNKLLSIIDKELKSDFQLDWITTNSKYCYPFAKISRKNTVFHEIGIPDDCQTGIFVDIFPLDLCSGYSKFIELKKQLIRRILATIFAKNANDWSLRRLPHRLIGTVLSVRNLHKVMTRIMCSASRSGHSYYANFGSQYTLKKQTMPVEWYGNGQDFQFEGRSYNIPLQYSKVLTSIYGHNYMQLPPEHKRRSHYPEKVVFSDGETMVFGKPKHIVTIDEQ